MKKVVTVTLGSSKQDFEFETDFLGERFPVKRMGADGDHRKAWEMLRRQQASADAIGLGETSRPLPRGPAHHRQPRDREADSRW